ncbi:hypothetical protein DW103_03915 [Parabacteroides sp. AM08-6]|nr:hypothetical protein DW103_03915 [Parabacteroides sp. AM08-6]
MKINKDLVDAIMMLSFIILVLIGTTDFDNATTKNLAMVTFGIVGVIMVILRIIGMRQEAHRTQESDY